MTQATHAPEADRLATDAMAGRRGRDAAVAVAADARAPKTLFCFDFFYCISIKDKIRWQN
ncbi:hypothetical protein TYRP_011855 [Tyrophagus putrescentiae]|nr:hypothetical protein TYRP_011855 [Tyrophagus putrescentiae]